MTKKMIRWLAVLFALTLIAAACGDDDSATTTTADPGAGGTTTSTAAAETTSAPDTTTAEAMDPIKFFVVNQESGLLAFPNDSAAISAYVAYLNAEKGGVAGHPIEMELCGTGDDPESAVACAQQVANDDDAYFMLGGQLTNSAAMWDTMTQSGKATFGAIVYDIPDLMVPGFYLVDPGSLVIAQATLEAMQAAGAEDIGVVYLGNEIGESSYGLVDALWQGFGGTTRGVAVDEAEADYLGALAAANVNEVDALFVIVDPTGCQPVADGLATLGSDVDVYTLDWCLSPENLEAGFTEGWFLSIYNSGFVGGDADAAEARRILADYGPDVYLQSEVFSMLMYTQFTYDVVSAAAEAVGFENLTPEAIHEAAVAATYDLFLLTEATCPGPEPWVSQCAPVVGIAQVNGEELVMIQDFKTYDPAIFNWILEG